MKHLTGIARTDVEIKESRFHNIINPWSFHLRLAACSNGHSRSRNSWRTMPWNGGCFALTDSNLCVATAFEVRTQTPVLLLPRYTDLVPWQIFLLMTWRSFYAAFAATMLAITSNISIACCWCCLTYFDELQSKNDWFVIFDQIDKLLSQQPGSHRDCCSKKT